MISNANGFSMIVYDIANNMRISEVISASAFSANVWHHLVVTLDSTIANGGKIYLNGALLNTSTNSSFVPNTNATRLYIGSTYSPTYQSNCIFDDINIYKTVLNSSEIKAIYNKNYALGFEQNYWSAVKIINPNFKPIFEIGGKWNFEVDLIEVLS